MKTNAGEIKLTPRCDEKVSPLTMVLTIALLISIGIGGYQFITIKKLERELTRLNGDLPASLELVSADNRTFHSEALNEDDIILLFVFDVPCTTCNKNLASWKMLTDYFGKKVTVAGVTLDEDPRAFDIEKDGRLKFKLYMPVDTPQFIRTLNIDTTTPHTMVIRNKRIVAHKKGVLVADDLNRFMAVMRKLIKKRNGGGV